VLSKGHAVESLKRPSEVDSLVLIPILRMRRLRSREVKLTACNWQCQDPDPGLLGSTVCSEMPLWLEGAGDVEFESILFERVQILNGVSTVRQVMCEVH